MREVLGVNDNLSISLNPAPQLDNEIRIVGHVVAELYGEDGQLKAREENHNLIVNNGKYMIAELAWGGNAFTKPTHMSIGTGVVAPAAGDTALGGEVGTRQAVSASRSTNVITFTGSFGAGVGTGAITEAGIHSAVSAGTMYSRVTFSAINKGANDTLQLTWTWTIG